MTIETFPIGTIIFNFMLVFMSFMSGFWICCAMR